MRWLGSTFLNYNSSDLFLAMRTGVLKCLMLCEELKLAEKSDMISGFCAGTLTATLDSEPTAMVSSLSPSPLFPLLLSSRLNLRVFYQLIWLYCLFLLSILRSLCSQPDKQTPMT